MHPVMDSKRDCRFLGALTAVLALAPVLSSSRAEGESVRWVREANARATGVVSAVAIEAASGALAFGDEVGVWIRPEGASARRVFRGEGVADIEFGLDGSLWVGAADGLWRIAARDLGSVGSGGGAEDRSAAPGAAARQVHRVARSGRGLAVATEAGVFVSADGVSWLRVDEAAPAGAASAVALDCSAETRCELWWVAGSAVWRADVGLTKGSGRVSLERAREAVVAGAPTAVAPVDIAVAVPGQRAVVVYPQSLAASDGEGRFRIWRPVLPPGAQARRFAFGLGRYWLGTDRGLMVATDLHSAWRRAGVPAGWLASSAVAAGDDRLFVGTASGVVRADRVGGVAPEAKALLPVVARSAARVDPSRVALERLHRLALAHLSLDPARQRDWRRRVNRRGWWPEVDVQLGYGGSLDRGIDEDQAFVSSAKRQLNDRDRGRGDDWDASLSFKWDLPEAIFDGEVLDVAREERLWISLRDDVLDEVNQLYFERRRVLLELAATPDADSLEAARLRLRAEELAAGLDAWTGGGFRSSEAAFDHPREPSGGLGLQPARDRSFPTGSRTE